MRTCRKILQLHHFPDTLHLTKLLMGWTNAVPIFHDDVMHILQLEVPQYMIPYINDVPIHGPASTYQAADSTFETILENSGICRFVWEHFQNLNRIIQRISIVGGRSPVRSRYCACEKLPL